MIENKTIHKPVLLNEIIEGLSLQQSDIVLDGTVGGGGYFTKICFQLDKRGMVIGLDQDKLALERVEKNLSKQNFKCKSSLVNENFRNLDLALKILEIEKVDKIVFDLGISSDQLDNSGRGFSFQKNEPLLMSLKKNLNKKDLSAAEIVNTWDEENLADIIFGYGEEKFSRSIAREICEARKVKKIETTFELVEIIKKAVPKWYLFKKTHFATKTFQALRITVNDEIESLKEGLVKGFESLNEGGRFAVVSFHSLEERVVKKFFKELKKEGKCILVNKKPITPSHDEIKENSRSRSAKLRIIEKI
ncbi:MAG: 16S rRNA (cytosine(1402)-N(4))-methyltransferase RsmH [Candidatus Pacebacteria bacterium]|nr:16S rRNA (cytosine(1402)-N(4))-methyltransferase RsmH [Candidatus Paceibacterota bacterium]